MEKYAPVTVQEAINANLRSFITPDQQRQLDYYIKSRRKELHGVILDNDDLPDVIHKINTIRISLGRIPYPSR